MKKTILLQAIITLLLTTTVLATPSLYEDQTTHYFVTEDLPSTQDKQILKQLQMSTEFEGIAQSNGAVNVQQVSEFHDARQESDVNINRLDNRVTVFIYESEALVIVGKNSPSNHQKLAEKFKSILESDLNIKTHGIIQSNEITDSSLQKTLQSISSAAQTDQNNNVQQAIDNLIQEQKESSTQDKNTESSIEEQITVKKILDTVTAQNTIAVLGDLSSDIDGFFTINNIIFGNKLQAYGQDDDNIKSAMDTKHIIMIGGPCTNSKYWSTYSSETCSNWPYKKGQSLVKAIKKRDQNILLISGTTRDDTFEIIERLSHSPHLSMFTKDNVEFTSSSSIDYQSTCTMQTDYCQEQHLGFELEYEFEGESFTIMVTEISDDKNRVTLQVDGEKVKLIRGEKVTVHGVDFTFDNINRDPLSGKVTRALLLSSEKVPLEYGTRSVPHSEGNFNTQGGLFFLRFPQDETIIKMNVDKISVEGNYVEVRIEGDYHKLTPTDKVVVKGVELTFEKAEKGLEKPIAFFTHKR